MFAAHGLAVAIAMPFPRVMRRVAARGLHMGVLATDDRRVLRMGFLGLTKYRRGLPRFVPATDEELAALPLTTTVLLGRSSAIHHARRLAARLERVAPHVEVVLVPGAGHSLPLDRPEVVAEHVRRRTTDHTSPGEAFM
jgi:pimeloyl-ACP methyl ester carboxylesterase